jgi:hypothetical protein
MAEMVFNPETGQMELVESKWDKRVTPTSGGADPEATIPFRTEMSSVRPRNNSLDPEGRANSIDLNSEEATNMKNIGIAAAGAGAGGMAATGMAMGAQAGFGGESPTTNAGQNAGQNLATSPVGRAALGRVPVVGPVLQNPMVAGTIGAGIGGAIGSIGDEAQGNPTLSPQRQASEAIVSGAIGALVNKFSPGTPGEVSESGEDVATLITRTRLDTGETPDQIIRAINDSQAARSFFMRGTKNAAQLSEGYDKALLDTMGQSDGVMGLSEINRTISKVNQYAAKFADDPRFMRDYGKAVARFQASAGETNMSGEKLLRQAMGDGNFESGIDTAVDSASLLVRALDDQPELRTKFIRTWMRRNFIERAFVEQGEAAAEKGVGGAFRQNLETLANPTSPRYGMSGGVPYKDAGAKKAQAFYVDGDIFGKYLDDAKAADLKFLLGGGNPMKGEAAYNGLKDLKDLMKLLNPKEALEISGKDRALGAIGDQVKYSERNLVFRYATGINGSNAGDITGRGATAAVLYGIAAGGVYHLDQMLSAALTKPSLIGLLRDGIKSGDQAVINAAWRGIGQALQPGKEGADPLATDAMNRIRNLGGAF